MNPQQVADVKQLRRLVELGMHVRPPGYTNPAFSLNTAFLASLLYTIDEQHKEIEKLRGQLVGPHPGTLTGVDPPARCSVTPEHSPKSADNG